MILETPRLILRPFRPDDVDLMHELFTNADFMRFSLGVFTEREQTAAFIGKCMRWEREGKPTMFAATLRPNEQLIGYCGFFHHPEHGIADVEIGYRLNPAFWNRGLITEGARKVRDHAFADLKLPRVISLIHPDNIPSRRVAQKNGMKIDNEIMFRGFPTHVWAMTREQWLALPKRAA